jgi:non-ribosomal peptide synthetase component F
MLDMHHIISDGTSFIVFFTEFITLYEGKTLPLLRLQYKDYALWQESEGRQAVIKQQEKYWLDVFREKPPLLQLPLDMPRPQVKNFTGRHYHFLFDTVKTTAIKKLALQEGATLFMVLLAFYNVLLAKITGQEDSVVGISIAGRRHSDLMSIIGMFVNALPLRNFPTKNKTFKQFLEELRTGTLSAYENQDYPFELLVEKAAGPRDPARNPVFDTMFVLNSEDEFREIHIPGLSIKANPDFENLSAQMDIKLRAADAGDTISLSFEYSTSLFKQETIEIFVANFHEVSDAVLAEPWTRIQDIKITTGLVRVEDDISDVEFTF